MATSVRTTIVLPGEKLKELKRLAFEQGSTIGRLVNEALDRVFFKRRKQRRFHDLRGLWKGRRFSESAIEAAKLRMKTFPS
ncbi:MAG: hypothetical protein HYV03_05735 [Deltaproteobacteria bacterium]|nr:hypothetical protein [Deltaproteobacteria bacterium]